MALINCQFFSDAIGMMSKMVVVLPQEAKNRIGMSSSGSEKKGSYPVLYLLHGMSDDETVWTRRTSIERYAQEKGIAVVMPTTHRSFYTNAHRGYKYFDHVALEVPALAREFFPISNKREENFIAGLSMGGYGAFRIATLLPDQFCAAASLSGALDMAGRFSPDFPDSISKELLNIFGPAEEVRNSDKDLFHTTREMLKKDCPPTKLYQCCGTEDFLYEANIRYRDFAKELEIDYTYEEGPGSHNWGYWDTTIQKVLDWLPLPENK